MAKGNNQKLKLIYLIKLMLEKTDDENGLTMPQIIEELTKYDVTAERKSIYADFQDMEEKLGIDIIREQRGRETYYHAVGREFELAEVKLLIDAIEVSKFITEKKSRALINKIKGLVSEHQAKQLQRQVHITDRVKAMNENVYYNVDSIHEAISENKKIKFQYCKWNLKKELIPRRNGEFFVISPWSLTWDDENYYLIAYDEWDQKIKNYRVDKMKELSVLDKKREGREVFDAIDISAYSKTRFGMFSGDTKKVYIEFPNEKCGIFIDQFGQDITFRKVDENHSAIAVDVTVSNQFFGWIFALGKEVKVTGPEEVVAQMQQAIEEVMGNYKIW